MHAQDAEKTLGLLQAEACPGSFPFRNGSLGEPQGGDEALLRQAEQTSKITLAQRRFGSSGGAIVLIIAFTILCLGSIL